MDPSDTEYVKAFRKSLEGWTDHRFVTAEQIEDLAMFHLYLVNLAEADGWAYHGHSVTEGTPMCRLVVRGAVDGTPSVVFTSGRTTMGCVRTFLRKMKEGWLEWSVDKYRT